MTPAEIVDEATLRRFFAIGFGAMPGEHAGVLHVAAVWRSLGVDRNVVLRIGDRTPRSEIDSLLLNLGRARADAIVTTGRILREEREVTHDLQGTAGVRSALHAWRRDALGLTAPPWLLVLTSGRDLDLRHPALHAWARPIVFCPEASADQVARQIQGTRVEVVAQAVPDLRCAFAFLHDQRGARRISIEAGPSTAIEAYREPAILDELLLSVFMAAAIPESLEAGELPPPREIERILGPARAAFEVEEPSGRWRFEHYRCAMVGGDASPR